MASELRWHIGKEGGTETRLDVPPFRAYFYWVENNRLQKSEDYSEAELVAEIERRKAAGEPLQPFQDALKSLKRTR